MDQVALMHAQIFFFKMTYEYNIMPLIFPNITDTWYIQKHLFINKSEFLENLKLYKILQTFAITSYATTCNGTESYWCLNDPCKFIILSLITISAFWEVLFKFLIYTNYSTSPSSTAIVTCAKFCKDYILKLWIRIASSLHPMWVWLGWYSLGL